MITTAVIMSAAATCPAAGTAYPLGLGVAQQGPESLVFDPTSSSCATAFNPDQSVRAFRPQPPADHVALTLPEHQDLNRLAIGPDLDHVVEDCTNLLGDGGALNPDPTTYHFGERIGATYRLPGSDTVVALLHTEYHGWGHPGSCSTNNAIHGLSYCFEAVITQAKTDSEGVFQHAWGQGPPAHRVASIPHRYTDYNTSTADEWGANGYRELTNIVKDPSSDYYYTIFSAQQFPKNGFAAVNEQTKQGFGSCVVRTTDLDDPSSWRAWGDGDGVPGLAFDVRFIDAYRESTTTPERHVCKPIARITNLVPRSLTYNTYFNKFMLVGQRAERGDILFSLSDDLVTWSTPRLILDGPTVAEYGQAGCQGSDRPVRFPSVIDPDDSSANFERPDDTVYMFFNKLEMALVGDPPACTVVNQELVRMPLHFSRQSRWASGVAEGCSGGFDSHRVSPAFPGSSFSVTTARNYMGADTSYLATTAPGAFSEGVVSREGNPLGCPELDPERTPEFAIGRGNDVWYGGAFAFPHAGFWDKRFSEVRVLQLDNGRGAAGVISITGDGRAHFKRDPRVAVAKDEVELMKGPDGRYGVPLKQDGDCWHFFDIHQKIGGLGQVDEIWLDGVKQRTRRVPNWRTGPYTTLRAGIVAARGNRADELAVYTDLVGMSYVGPLHFNGCRGVGE